MLPIFRRKYPLAFVVLSFLPLQSMAFRFSLKGQDSYPTDDDDVHKDLGSLVRPLPSDQTGIYTNALHILSSLQSSPSCSRIATEDLLGSCQAIEGSAVDSETQLDDTKSIYAARLAVCEIESADSTIPHACKGLASSPATKQHQNSNPAVRKAQLSECLQSLESRAQWWTSYSNSRQNAVVMCQAARIDIDKDALIKLHKSLVSTNQNANEALSRAAKISNDGLSQLQKDISIARQRSQESMAKDMGASSSKAQAFFAALVEKMSQALQTSVGKISSTVKDAESGVASLRKNVQNANTISNDLENQVEKVFRKVAHGSGELAKLQTAQWDAASGLALGLQGTLRNIQAGEMSTLVSTLSNIDNQMKISNELVSSMYMQQSTLQERMNHLDEAFTEISTKAEMFQEAQARQADTQAILHSLVDNDIQKAGFLLAEVATSAKALQAAVDETHARVSEMTSLNWIFNGFATTMTLIALAVVVVALWQFNAKLAQAIGAAIVLWLLVTKSDVSSYLRAGILNIVFHQNPFNFESPFLFAGIILGILLFAIFLHSGLGYIKPTRTIRVPISGLPFIRATNLERQHRK